MFKYFYLAALLGAVCIAETEVSLRNPLCLAQNGYFSIEGSCDNYLECVDFNANEMMCPDGLHFNPRADWPEYPCAYPNEISCVGRGNPQPAQPTAECPHQYGFHKSPKAHPQIGKCGQYRMCVAGMAIEMVCPTGLAFNADNARCDWPDNVPECKVEAFLGFSCPPAPIGEDGKPMEVVNYKYEDDCSAFYTCEHGRPRLLPCEEGYAFDAESGRCVEAEKVGCVKLMENA